MTVYAYGMDQLTANAIREQGIEIVIVSSIGSAEDFESGSILIINGEDLPLSEVFKIREIYKEITVAYIDTAKDMRQSVMHAAQCSMKNIEYFSSKATAETYTVRLQQLLKMNIDGSTHIIGFFGSGTGVGTTAVSTQFAKRIAAAGKKVVHLGLDLFDPGWDKKVNVSLDVWRPKLTAKIIQADDFNGLVELEGVSYLPGNFDYLSNFDYTVEEISYLLDRSQEVFDVVVADFGSICDSAAWYVGMQKSAIRVMVTHPEHEYRLRSIQETISHLNLDYTAFFGIFNKGNTSISGVSAKDIERSLDLNIIMEFPAYVIDNERKLPIGKKEQSQIDDQVRHFLTGFGFSMPEAKRRGFI